MSELTYVLDFTTKENPGGGAELVDTYLIKELDANYILSTQFNKLNQDKTYIFSNISLINPRILDELNSSDGYKYCIMEHDYKFHHTRHPWRFQDSLVPKEQIINRELYKNAKAIFVQTDDHADVFKRNEIEGNIISLKSSIWDPMDLDLLSNINSNRSYKSFKYAIYASKNWIKNPEGAARFCEDNNLAYEPVYNSSSRREFLEYLGKYSTLVFFPLARETLCRLVVEAKCLEMNVITTKNYGASLSPWFNKYGKDLIDFLREQSKENLKLIKEYL